MSTEIFPGINDAPNPILEIAAKDTEDFDAIHDFHEHLDKVFASFRGTGDIEEDTEILKRLLKLPRQLGHKSPEATKRFLANVLSQRFIDMEKVKTDYDLDLINALEPIVAEYNPQIRIQRDSQLAA